MEEKKAKRFIWWISAAIAVILCTVTVLLLIPSEGQDAADKPTEPTIPSVLQTPAPTVLSPEPTVEPTAYLLPLVPLGKRRPLLPPRPQAAPRSPSPPYPPRKVAMIQRARICWRLASETGLPPPFYLCVFKTGS